MKLPALASDGAESEGGISADGRASDRVGAT